MSVDNDLQRNSSQEIVPQGYSPDLSDWKEVIVDSEGKQYIRATELEDKIGEVQNEPTANTLLARMKSLEDKIDAVNANIDDSQDAENNIKATLNGINMALSQNPKVGTKTVTSTAAEIFADTSRLSGRSIMYIRNTHDSIAIRIGASNTTDVKGRRILPSSEEKIEFDPSSNIPIYAISEFGDVEVEVFEA